VKAKLVNEKLEKPRARYSGKTLKADAFSKFLQDKSFPLVGIKNSKTASRSKIACICASGSITYCR
jgi:hypothetical protein